MSPEQAGGEIKRLDSRSDVFSLGAILCEILIGQPPYWGEDIHEVRIRAVRGDLAGALEKLDGCGAESDLILLAKRCLSFFQLQRPDDGQAVADEVGRIRAEAEARARRAEMERSEALVREAEAFKRRRQFLLAASAIGVVLLVGVMGTGFGFVQARASALAEKNAKEQAQHAELAERSAKEEARKSQQEAVLRQKEAETERQRAEEREQDAIEAVKRFGDVVAKNADLKQSSQLKPLRRALLKEPIVFFTSLRKRLEEDQNTSPKSLVRLSAAAFELGMLSSHIGDMQDAIRSYEEAKAIRLKLVAQKPEDGLLLMALANCRNNLGQLLLETGKLEEAKNEFEEAIVSWRNLRKEHPAGSQIQLNLTKSLNNLSRVLLFQNEPAAALQSQEEAVGLIERLVSEDENNTALQLALADNQNNLAKLLNDLGRRREAKAVFEKSKTTWLRLNKEHSQITEFQSGLAGCYKALGSMCADEGDFGGAMESLRPAIGIFEKLAGERPAEIEFQAELANCYTSLGLLQRFLQKPEDALKSYEAAKSTWERLTHENPEVTDFPSRLGGAINNLAQLRLDAGDFTGAKSLLLTAIEHQKAALSKMPMHPTYRRFLQNHYLNLRDAAKGLQDGALETEAKSNLLELKKSDPQYRLLDLRMEAVVSGAPAKDVSEMLDFARRCYEVENFPMAVQFYGEALQREPRLTERRDAQFAYSAACSAAQAADGQGAFSTSLDAAAKEKLRRQAMAWLKGELGIWRGSLEKAEKPEARALLAQMLGYWLIIPDLAAVRDAEKLAALPEAERKEWEALWGEVKEVLENARADSKSE